ncbi:MULTISPECIES: hypothetical protein [Nocardiaceae]|uniref:Cyclic nucleotide-binding domain-containing protein n=1 Tax=Rhodococcoides corynebacterioides TaxID=53972 RepID=A0ABS2KUA7_9NOCA|nr:MULTISPECIES: hypothetical protein [Rhodococcus]MBM7415528.1 hypothetical protein [Rhodococcus corynebacterioides]MBP1117990.1 hypothetical protein [Rhodococcus sp. PvP016]
MSGETPTLAELIARHRASARLSVTTRLEASYFPVSTPADPVRLEVSRAPGDRWRVDRAGATVYVRDGDDAFVLHEGMMHTVAADTRQMVALQPVNPLWFFGEQSLMLRWADAPPDPETATVAGSVTVEGRLGRRIMCPALNFGDVDDPMEFVVDDATGLVLQIASSSGHLMGTLRNICLVQHFPAGTFAWTGPVATLPDENT